MLENKVNQILKQTLKNKKKQEAAESVWKEDWEVKQKEREDLFKKELEKLRAYKENYQRLYSSLEENQAKGILTKEEADSFFQIWKMQEKSIEEAMIKQENSKTEEYSKELMERKEKLSIIKRIEVEEGGHLCMILNNGEKYKR